MLGFAAVEVNVHLRSAQDAARSETLVRDAGAAAIARAQVQNELVPAVARAVISMPALGKTLGVATGTVKGLAPSADRIARLRDRTDTSLARLAAAPAIAATARQVVAQVRTARSQIDSGRGLPAGYLALNDAATRLGAIEIRQVERANSLGVDVTTADRLNDVDLVATGVDQANGMMPTLVSTEFTGATAQARAAVFKAWGGAQATSADLLTDVAPDIADAWRQASTSKAAKRFDELFAAVIMSTKHIDTNQLALLYLLDQQRSSAMLTVLTRAISDATQSAAAQRDRAEGSAWLIGGILALVALISVGIAVAVWRAMSAPLSQLAERANSVSAGDLVAVGARGPREVRTVARGLSAAVDNLRKVAAQATAVAAGDLTSEVVREPLPGALGAVMHRSVSTIVDAIHDRDAAKSDLAHRATHDVLTELPNRSQAMTFIRRSLHRAQRTGAMTGLMFIDLDHFKGVNDTFGHAAGDLVLQTCASRMIGEIRGGDCVFRLAGDEFLVLLEDVSTEMDAVHLAERLIESLSAPIAVENGTAIVGASIGIAFSLDASVDAERLLNDADAAAYRAKNAGRGRVGIFDDELRATLASRAELEAAMSHALAHDELRLHYQPIIELETGRTLGVEALMRWERPGHGLVMPHGFIPAAETSMLINGLGRWALSEATAQLARWDAADGPSDLTMSVNISGRHLVSTHLVEDVRTALDASGIAPERLVIELPETVLVNDPIATENMTRLRDLGVGIAIDDFGTGFTSIGQLPHLPIDRLKIDRSFIASPDPAHLELVRLIVAAAHAFGLTVVAEGIELAEQLDSLDRAGVDSGQGYFFARPQPAAAAAPGRWSTKQISV